MALNKWGGSNKVGGLNKWGGLGIWGDLGGGTEEAINSIYVGSSLVSDVKYFDGVSLKDVNLYINGEIVWST